MRVDGESHPEPPLAKPDEGGVARVRGRRAVLLDAIAEGAFDDRLGAIAETVDARRRLLETIDSSHMFATLRVGDRVRIAQRVSPRYLAGLERTLVELDDRAATVLLDFAVGRFESGRVRYPPVALEKR
jgi:hypothetical protein